MRMSLRVALVSERRRAFAVFAGSLIAVLLSRAAKAQSYRLAYSFSGDMGASRCTLAQTADGRLYATTELGGAFGQGSLFVLNPDGTGGYSHITLHSFSGGDGANPRSALTEGRDGRLYGTTENGGPTDGGTVFQIDQAGNLITLHSFAYFAKPRSALIQATDGNFYGTTYDTTYGGSVFRIDASGWFITLHEFGRTAGDGRSPQASLIQARDGSFYGTTSQGGTTGLGTVFRMDSLGQVTVLHSFKSEEGFQPTASLIQGTDGDIYGTTEVGGSERFGTAFKMDLAGNLTVLHSFSEMDGANPSGLLLANDGNLYGTTGYGGANKNGTVFRLSTLGTFTIIHNFTGSDGFGQKGPLIQASGGDFYGMTYQGGRNNRGTVFKISASGTLTTLRNFGIPEGAAPGSALLPANDGSFYGTAYGGGAFGSGTVFRIDAVGTLTILHSFSGYNGVPSNDGGYPRAGLIHASDGSFYGTTSGGGAFGNGTAFKISAGSLTIIHSFRSSEGSAPIAALIQASDGRFYGTTSGGGGSQGNGTLFRMDSTGGLTVLHAFSGQIDGAGPYASLLQASNGSFYGTSSLGGANGSGTVFRMDSSGNVTTLHAFSGIDGAVPHAALVQAPDGNLYGTTTGGGGGWGTIFRIDVAGNFTKLHDFDFTRDGATPEAPLLRASDGNFYGTTSKGGAGLIGGTIFRMETSGVVSVVYKFDGNVGFYSDGRIPTGSLVEGAPSVLYGTLSQGGAGGAGAIYRLSLDAILRAEGLAIEAPASVLAGTPFTIIVKALDSSGRPAESYRGTIRFDVVDSRAVRPFTYTFTAVDAGSHAFINGFVLYALGPQNIGVTDSVISSVSGATGVAVTPVRWAIIVAKSGNAGGRVTSVPTGIDCGDFCSATFADSSIVTLKVTPDPGFVLDGWSGSLDCSDALLTADSNKICVPRFDMIPVRPARSPSRGPRRVDRKAPTGQ